MLTSSIKRVFIAAAFLLVQLSAHAQKKMIERILSGEKDTTRASSFLALPVIGYSQETKWQFGAVAFYSFYTDRQDTLTRNSTVVGVATVTTAKQSNFQLKSDIWAPQNRYRYIGEIRYRDFPFNFYGVGDRTLDADRDNITQKVFKVAAGVEKRFGPAAYTGINVSFEDHIFEDGEPGGIYETGGFIFDRDGGKVLFLGLSQSLDSRNTNTYTTKGTYIKLNYSYAPNLFGGENFEGSFAKIDIRNFSSFNNKTVLGVQAVYQGLAGSTRSPFYLLPQMGNDEIMRGYYQGRYRNANLLALQAEIRYRFIPQLGVAGFLGGGTVYSNGNLRFGGIKPSYGAGLRYFFDVERGLSIRLDYGIGEKRPGEERQTGFYLSIGEAF